MKNKEYSKKILGLDMGVSSLGWGIIGENLDNGKWDIVDFGVRIWDVPENSKTKDTKMSERRNFRASRRTLQRKSLRISDLKKYLEKINLISKEEINNHFEKISDKSEKTYNVTHKDYFKEINPLFLREKGLEEKLTPLQIAISLINISKYRGYSNKFDLLKEESDKEEKNALEIADKLVKKYGYPIKAINHDELFWLENKITGEKIHVTKNRVKSSLEKKEIKDLQLILENNLVPYDKNLKKPELIQLLEKENIIDNKEFVTFNQKHLVLEVRALLEKQREFYPTIFIKENIDHIINNIIFRQRDFEDGPGPKDEEKNKNWIESISKFNHYTNFMEMIGYCQFLPNEKRTNAYTIFGDIWAILNEIDKLFSKSIIKNLEESNLSLEQVSRLIFKSFFNNFTLNIKTINKLLKDNYGENIFQFQENKTTDKVFEKLFLTILNKDKTINTWFINNFKLIDFDDFISINESKINKLGQIFYKNRTPKRLIIKIYELISDVFANEKDVEKWLNKNKLLTNVSKNVFSVSNKHIFNCYLKQLNEGITVGRYQEDLKAEIKNQFLETNKQNYLLDINSRNFLKEFKDWDMIKNAVVFRSINQTRKVLREIIRKYGNFDKIVIEVASDVYSEKELRKRIESKNQIRERENEEIENHLIKNGYLVNNSNKLRYKLYLSQQKKKSDTFAYDPYSLWKSEPDRITFQMAMDGTQTEVEHILPHSLTSNDSFRNKILVSRKNNQKKGNKIAYEYISQLTDKEGLTRYKKEINNLFRQIPAKVKFLTSPKITHEMILEEESRSLNDIRYITGYVKENLEEELLKYNFNTSFITIKGTSTSFLRRNWLSNSPWGFSDKPRDITPFHHSVDSLIVANMDNKLKVFAFEELIATFNLMNKNWKSRLKKGFIDWNYIEKGMELHKKSCLIRIGIIKRYLPKEEKQENEMFFNEVTSKLLEQIDKIYNFVLIENFDNNVQLKDFTFSKYWNPLVENFEEKIENLIPVKLKIVNDIDKNKKEVKLDKIVTLSEWSKDNNLPESEYPFVSTKVERRVRGVLGEQNATKQKEISSENKGNYFKDRGGNWINKSAKNSFLGLRYDLKESKWKKYYRFDALKQKEEKEIIISRNTAFVLVDYDFSDIKLYKSLTGLSLNIPNINLKFNNTEKYRQIINEKMDSPIISINKLNPKFENNILEGIEYIISFDLLGKICSITNINNLIDKKRNLYLSNNLEEKLIKPSISIN